MHARKRIVAVIAAMAAVALPAAAAHAGSGGQLRVEKAWYDGHEVTFLQPSLFSANPNGGVLGCFGLGPDLTRVDRPTQPLYVVFDNSATQDHCDGQPDAFRHDHILPAAPGDPGYSGAWTLVLLVEATPGSIDLATHPFTTAAQVLHALGTGELIDVTSAFSPDSPPKMIAPVIGGN